MRGFLRVLRYWRRRGSRGGFKAAGPSLGRTQAQPRPALLTKMPRTKAGGRAKPPTQRQRFLPRISDKQSSQWQKLGAMSARIRYCHWREREAADEKSKTHHKGRRRKLSEGKPRQGRFGLPLAVWRESHTQTR